MDTAGDERRGRGSRFAVQGEATNDDATGAAALLVMRSMERS